MGQARLTSTPNGILSFVVNTEAEEKTANYSVVMNTDAGKTFYSQFDGMVYTLPDSDIGNTFTIFNLAPSGTAAVSIVPDTLEAIVWAGQDVNATALVNTKATAKVGDYVVLASEAFLDKWMVVGIKGIWAIT